jgi:hypothetical protein
MRTNIDLQDDLVDEALSLTGTRTKREVVELALRELIARRKRPSVSAIFGIGGLDPAYQYKQLRSGTPQHRVEQPIAVYDAQQTKVVKPTKRAARTRKAR